MQKHLKRFTALLLIAAAARATYISVPIEEIRSKAESGDGYYQTVLGIRYREGEGCDTDFNEALIWLRRAAEKEHPLARYHLGQMFRNGQGLSADAARADSLFTLAAAGLLQLGEQGDPRAQEALSLAYLYGLGVNEAPDSALMWMERSGEQGFPKAMLNLGIAHYHGLCGPVNYAKSKSWYERLAETGDDRAAYKLAGFYAFGLGVEADLDTAISLCRDIEVADEHAESMRLEGDIIIKDMLPPKHTLDIEEGSCGEACLWTVINSKGIRVTQLEINKAGGFPGRGLHGDELFPALDAFDVPHTPLTYSVDAPDSTEVARRYHRFLYDDILNHLKQGNPVLIGIKVYPTKHTEWPFDHFVLLVGYNPHSGELIFNDFSKRKRIRIEKLLDTTPGYSFINPFNWVYAIAFPLGEDPPE